MGVGAEVADALLLRAAPDHDPRELLGQRDRQPRVGLVVAVLHVEARVELLDPGVLQLQRLDLGADDGPLDRGRGGHHRRGARVQVGEVLEVRRQPGAQVLGLADVDDPAAGVAEPVDARRGRDRPRRRDGTSTGRPRGNPTVRVRQTRAPAVPSVRGPAVSRAEPWATPSATRRDRGACRTRRSRSRCSRSSSRWSRASAGAPRSGERSAMPAGQRADAAGRPAARRERRARRRGRARRGRAAGAAPGPARRRAPRARRIDRALPRRPGRAVGSAAATGRRGGAGRHGRLGQPRVPPGVRHRTQVDLADDRPLPQVARAGRAATTRCRASSAASAKTSTSRTPASRGSGRCTGPAVRLRRQTPHLSPCHHDAARRCDGQLPSGGPAQTATVDGRRRVRRGRRCRPRP